MKIQEVILRALAKKITWWKAAEIIGISDRVAVAHARAPYSSVLTLPQFVKACGSRVEKVSHSACTLLRACSTARGSSQPQRASSSTNVS